MPTFLMMLALATNGSTADGVTLKPGDAAPAIDATILDDRGGQRITLASLAGQVLVIDFWATWCGPCLRAFPELNRLRREFDVKPVRFLSITYEAASIVKPILEKHPLETTVALDNACATFRSYGAWGLPRIVLVGRDARVKGVIAGDALTADVIRDVLAGQTPDLEQAPPWPDPKGAEALFCGS